MAQVDSTNNPNDPNNPNNLPGQQAPQNQNANQPAPATSGGAGAVTPTGAANVTGQVVGTNTPSQPFQNIASYLAANAPQSETLAGQVASGVTQPIAQTNADIANASQGFQQSVNSGYTPLNADLISRVAANPTEVAANPNDVAAFQAQLNNTYKGPTDFTTTPNYANLESEIANAQSAAKNAQTPTGIQTLLQNVEGPTTAGINNLDTLLLAQNPKNFNTISSAGTPAAGLGALLDTQTAQNNAAAQKALADAQAAKSNAGSALTNQETALATQLQNELAQAQGNYTNYNANVNNINSLFGVPLNQVAPANLLGGGISPDVVNAIADIAGFNQSDQNENYALPLGSTYLTKTGTATPPTPQSIATMQDAVLAQALSALSGGSYTAPVTTPGDYTLPSEPSLNKDASTEMGGYLYDLLQNQVPKFQAATDPNKALKDYQDAILQLQNFLGIAQPTKPPVTGGLPPVGQPASLPPAGLTPGLV